MCLFFQLTVTVYISLIHLVPGIAFNEMFQTSQYHLQRTLVVAGCPLGV